MEDSQSNTTTDTANPNPIPNNTNSILSSTPVWPTIDGPIGLTEDESLTYARRFYKFGFALLPWLWAVNCFYFWPVLINSRSFPRIRPYVIRSAVGFTVFTTVLCSWAFTFAIGGEQLFGPVWDKLVMYNVADRLGLTALRGWWCVATEKFKQHQVDTSPAGSWVLRYSHGGVVRVMAGSSR